MKLTLQEGKANKVHLLVDGEYRMTADREFIALSGITNNMELDDTELASLTGRVNSRRAFNKAADLLSRRDHSTCELLQKLRQKGFDAEAAQEAADRMQELGYLDDRRFAETYAAELAQSKGFGIRRIATELFRKGIARDIIDEVLGTLELPEDGLQALIRRKYARSLSTEQGVRRTFNALVRMGYAPDEIREALQQALEQTEQTEDCE